MFNAMLKDINAIPSRFSRILNLFYGLWDWVAIIRCVIKVLRYSIIIHLFSLPCTYNQSADISCINFKE